MKIIDVGELALKFEYKIDADDASVNCSGQVLHVVQQIGVRGLGCLHFNFPHLTLFLALAEFPY